jgi:hypothetical protein
MHMKRRRIERWAGAAGGLALLLLGIPGGVAAESPAVDFNRQVAPILIRHCSACHNPGDHAGSLSLLDAAGVATGGESAEPAVVAGNSAESPLYYRIEAGDMPPEGKGKPVSAEDLAILKQWIDGGAKWPEGRVLSPFEFTTDRRAGLDWWSLKPPVKPEVGGQVAAGQSNNPIDTFIHKKLAAAGLKMSPEADRATLIRRAMLDLHGLPPTPEEVQAFVADPAPDAYEKLIDHLLASPRYGESWARHWLDVVRFAESAGFETNLERPDAWPYRDYVIESFNSDKPYTQFIVEQLAGDQLKNPAVVTALKQQMPFAEQESYAADVATSFLVAGPNDAVKSPDVELTRTQRLGELNDMVSTTSAAFIGLTAGCAKCHDHKFDPISQHDYYALKAVFSGVQHGSRDISTDRPGVQQKRDSIRGELAQVEQRVRGIESQSLPLANVNATADPNAVKRPRVSPAFNVDRFAPVSARFVRFTIRATNSTEPCLDELEIFTTEPSSQNVALASAGAKATASSTFGNGTQPIHQLAHINDGQYGNSRSWISNEIGQGWIQIELPQATSIDRVAWARDREGVFVDRTAVDYAIEVALEPGIWTTVATSADRQPFDSQEPAQAAALTIPESMREEYAALQAKAKSLSAQLQALKPQMAYAGNFAPPSEPTFRLHRGEVMQRREEVAPGAIEAIGNPLPIDATTPEAERRLALARWLASDKNPLTARVMVNRIWHYHFGRGLMLNPSDFGFNGGKPSHPELLDWLACEFMETGWRPKHLHRLIMLSAAYRQASAPNAQAAAVDGNNALLWRFEPRRIEAEPIRDSILAVAGTLDLTMGGPGFEIFEPNGNYVKVYIPKERFGPAEWRRMIYMERPRMQQDATFGVFDCPDLAQPIGKRNTSTTALQALNLLNGPFMIQQSNKFAERLQRDAPASTAAQVQRAFWLAFGRAPDSAEQQAGESLIAAEGLPIFCRAILNSNELYYLQ